MRLRLVGLGVAFGFSLFATTTARAQDTGFSDPFFLYYSYFLPRQNALASQAQPEDFYRNQSLQRQSAAQSDRAGLFDPTSTLGQDDLDPNRPFGRQSGSSRTVRTVSAGIRTTVVSPRSLSAPNDSFQRTGAFFPGIRSGRGRGARAAGVGGVAALGAPPRSSFIPGPMTGAPNR